MDLENTTLEIVFKLDENKLKVDRPISWSIRLKDNQDWGGRGEVIWEIIIVANMGGGGVGKNQMANDNF